MFSYNQKQQLPTFGGIDKQREITNMSEETLLIETQRQRTFESEDNIDEIINEINRYDNISERLEQNTIHFQRQILLSFDQLQLKVEKLKQEREYFQQELSYQEQIYKESNIDQMFKEIIIQSKQIMQLGQSVSKMYEKIHNQQGSVKEILKWIGQMMQEYEDMKMNSLKWKQAYDFVYGQQ